MTAKSKEHLQAIFQAERTLHEEEANLFSSGTDAEIRKTLVDAVNEATSMRDRREASLRLGRLADLCAQLDGPDMVDALITILNDQEPSVRVAAGEALLDVGYERYAEVARAIERAIQKKVTGPAMAELPWIIQEIGEPSAVGLIRRFLEIDDPEAVAAAIESLVALGDPEAKKYLQPLKSDTRAVTLVDEDDESGFATTIGELATEAIKELS